MARLAVIGLGNPLAGDEGIGGRLVERLPAAYRCDDIEVRDLGTTLFSLVHLLPGLEKAVIVDCALMGAAPGAIRRFDRAEVASLKKLRHFSLHEGDVLSMIDVAASQGAADVATVFFGIEPEQMEWGRGLSPALEARLDEYLEDIARELGLQKQAAGDA